MPAPQCTPLLLLSEYVQQTNANDGTLTDINATQAARLRQLILSASDYIQRTCRRRFDERIETRYFDCLDERVGGDLLGPYDLQLDDDLRSVTTMTNGTGVEIVVYQLMPRSPGPGGVTAYSRVHLNVYGGVLFMNGGNDPYQSISIAGKWGYGGQWLLSSATVSNISGSTLTVSDGTQFEVGMVLKIDSEYCYVEGISTNTLTVTRAYNGSTSASHSASTAIYTWRTQDTIRDLCRRLVQWAMAQIQSPMAGAVTVGEFTFPVNTAGLPTDLYLKLRDAGLRRLQTSRGA